MIIQIIQFSGKGVTFARFRRTGKEILPVTGVRLTFSDHQELGRILAEQLQPVSEELHTILALDPASVCLRELSLPVSDRKKLRAVLPFELSGDTAEDAGELVCDALPLVGDGSLLAGWASVHFVAELVGILKESGMEPEVVTCSSLNWHRLPLPDQQEPFALVEEDSMMVCSREGIIFFRSLPTSPDMIRLTLAAVELSKGSAVKNIYRISGDLFHGEEKLPLPAVLSGQDAIGDLPPEMLISPLATAMSYCAGDIFNLRNGPLVWTGKRSHLFKKFRVPLVLGILLLLILPAEAGLRWYLIDRDLKSINSSIAAIYKQVFPTRKKAVDEIGELKAEIRRLQQGTAGSEVLAFLNMLAINKDEQIHGFSEVDYDGERFRLKGDARNSSAVTLMGQKLSTAGWIIEQPELTSRPDGMTLFVIKGRRGGSAR